MSKKWKIVIIVGVISLFVFYFSFVIWLFSGSGKQPFSGKSIALIRVDGVIASSGEGPFSSISTPEKIINQLRQANDDPSIAAILLRINSPGGTAGASQEIFTEVKRIEKPVIASVGDIAASGAYWIASGADKIVANSTSDVGSIGVIIQVPNLQKLFEKIGADVQTIKQGKYKDLGNPARPLTEEEIAILDKHSKIIYDIFIDEVASSRKIARKEVEELATGLTFPGVQARELKLIDQIGNYSDAVDLAGKLGRIKGKPNVVQYDKPGIFDFLTSTAEITKLLNTLSGLMQINQLNGIIYNYPLSR